MARLDRLDRTALVVIVALLASIGIVVARGDRVGVAVLAAAPAEGAQTASVRSAVRLVFAEPMDVNSLDGRLDVQPSISGTLRASGAAVIWTPAQALEPDADYTVTVRAGGVSVRGRAMLRDHALHFRTRRPRVAYLAPSQGAADLYLLDPGTGETKRVTSEPYGVHDFAIAPDGERAVITVNRSDEGERDLYLLDLASGARELLLRCDAQVCQTASWSADGTRIAFERRELVQRAIGKLPGPARVWLMDVATRETVPLFADTQRLGSLPTWSPVDDRLAFVDMNESAITVIDTAAPADPNSIVQLPSNLGDPGAWSPDGMQLIYPDITPLEDRGYNQVLRADFARDVITTVFPISTVNDAAVTFAPSGGRIAFSRQEAGSRALIGAQIWTARPDGANPQRLTSDYAFSHFEISWSPDERWLTAQRFELAAPYARPQVWLVDVASGEGRLLAEDAMQPAWAP
jgi:Tol biopolymer transport system component